MAVQHEPLALVKQENKTSGCGIACIAMLARISYVEALRYVFPSGKKLEVYTYYSHLRRALKRLGLNYEVEIETPAWESVIQLESTAIVACVFGEAEIWHWVVFDASVHLILDPLKDRPMEAHQLRRKPISCLPVTGIR